MSRLIILDHGLVDQAGHYYEYDMAIAQACFKQDIDIQIVAHKGWQGDEPYVIPFFDIGVGSSSKMRDIMHKFINQTPLIMRAGLYHISKIMFRLYSDFQKPSESIFVKQTLTFDCQKDDVIFAPNCSYADLLGFLKNAPHYKSNVVHILIRQMPQTRAEEKALLEALDYSWPSHFKLWSDTKHLSQWLTSRGLYADIMPIPMLVRDDIKARCVTPYRFSVLGPPRREKGTILLPYLITQCAQELLTNKMAFTIQIHTGEHKAIEPSVASAIKLLKKLSKQLSNITLIDAPLSLDAFYEAIEDSSCLLLPYDATRYENRSSGLFVQALQSGRPAIVPMGTWMADEMPDALKPYIWDGNDLYKKCKEIMNLENDFNVISKEWRAKHSAESCVDLLMKCD